MSLVGDALALAAFWEGLFDLGGGGESCKASFGVVGPAGEIRCSTVVGEGIGSVEKDGGRPGEGHLCCLFWGGQKDVGDFGVGVACGVEGVMDSRAGLFLVGAIGDVQNLNLPAVPLLFSDRDRGRRRW